MSDKKAPRNTAQEFEVQPLRVGSGIPVQEEQGQRLFVGSETLPTEMDPRSDYDTKAILEDAGVTFLGIVEGDDIFQFVELPAGWKKMSTNDPMWSKLIDDKGRDRATIFYKAAFYDRRAQMSLSTRFRLQRNYERQQYENVAVVHVLDRDEVAYATDPIEFPYEDDKKHQVTKQAYEAAVAWLDKNYPDWRNPGAYWD